MTVKDPSLSDPPGIDQLARTFAGLVDEIDEDVAREVLVTIQGFPGKQDTPYFYRGNEDFRRQLGYRLKQAGIRAEND